MRAGISEFARPMKLTATTRASNQFQGSSRKGLSIRYRCCVYCRDCIHVGLVDLLALVALVGVVGSTAY